ncbi:MAG: sulfite exporter TauE/SafE family protein [Polyangiaceae bacterium]|nr:sulfite exporter TauE/SafE family protein [Polyangiaceae bacterium]
MDSLPLLVPAAAAMGLAGGVHCAAMCGPLALAAGCERRDSAVYIATRSAGYVTLGAAAGAAGSALGARFPAWGTLAAGLVGLLVLLLVAWPSGRAVPGGRALAKIAARAPALRAPLLGLVTLLLPCGLLHGALALAWVSGAPSSGAVLLGVFAVTTAPFVLAAPAVRRLLSTRLSPAHAVRFERLSIWLGVVAVAGRTAWSWYAGGCH